MPHTWDIMFTYITHTLCQTTIPIVFTFTSISEIDIFEDMMMLFGPVWLYYGYCSAKLI